MRWNGNWSNVDAWVRKLLPDPDEMVDFAMSGLDLEEEEEEAEEEEEPEGEEGDLDGDPDGEGDDGEAEDDEDFEEYAEEYEERDHRFPEQIRFSVGARHRLIDVDDHVDVGQYEVGDLIAVTRNMLQKVLDEHSVGRTTVAVKLTAIVMDAEATPITWDRVPPMTEVFEAEKARDAPAPLPVQPQDTQFRQPAAPPATSPAPFGSPPQVRQPGLPGMPGAPAFQFGGIDPRSVMPVTPDPGGLNDPAAAFGYLMFNVATTLLAANQHMIGQFTEVTNNLIATQRESERSRTAEANRATSANERLMGRFVELNSARFQAEADRDIKIAERDREYASLQREAAERERKEAERIAQQKSKEVTELQDQLREAEASGDDEGAAALRQQLMAATVGVVGSVIDYFTRDRDKPEPKQHAPRREPEPEPEARPAAQQQHPPRRAPVPGAPPRPKVRPVPPVDGAPPPADDLAERLAALDPTERKALARKMASKNKKSALDFSVDVVDEVDAAGGVD